MAENFTPSQLLSDDNASNLTDGSKYAVNENDPTGRSGDRRPQGVTGTLLLAVFTAVCGTAFPFGYGSGVINAPQDVIEQFINDTQHRRHPDNPFSESTVTFIFSLAVSVFALGGMIGGLCSSFITDRFGRKGGMTLNNIVSGLSYILMFISKPAHSYEMLIVGRLILGIACGYGSSVAPLYISEVSPLHVRGTFGVAFQLGVVVALFISQIISLHVVLGSASLWHIALSLPIIFTVLQLVLLYFVPESPKYLLLKKKNTPATVKALQWLRNDGDVDAEISEMEEEGKTHDHAASIVTLFHTPTVRWALFLAVFLQLSQQFSGINAVIYYSTVIFTKSGFKPRQAEYANLGLGGTIIVITVISVFLIDRLGRRILQLTGIAGMLVTSLILVISLIIGTGAWNTISLIMTILFVAFFSVGPGSIPWLITAELFNHTFRAPASSIAVLVNWSANFVVSLGFKPLFTGFLDKYTFFLFTGFLLICFIVIFLYVPETKAKTVNEIYDEINRGQVWRKHPPQYQSFENPIRNIA